TNAICAPVLRFHVGETSGPCPEVRRFRFPPDASTTKIFGYPLRDDDSESFVPSGDQEGDRFIPLKRGKLTIRFRSNEYIMISHPLFWTELNASRDPSGEMRGDSEMFPRCVNWRWLLPS